MTDNPPYLVSYDFGQTFTQVPEDLWKYFGPQAASEDINSQMLAYPSTQGTLVDGTDMFGAVFIQTGRNPLDVAIWLGQGYHVAGAGQGGSYLEFDAWLWDRQMVPIPAIDDPGGTVLTPAPCVPGLVQWYWAAAAQTMTAAPRQRSTISPLQRFLRDLRAAECKWRVAVGRA